MLKKIDAFQVKLGIIGLIFFSFMLLSVNAVTAISDYNKGQLVINVTENQGKPIIAADLGFTNTNLGELNIKPTLVQALIFEQDVYRDEGAAALYFLVVGIIIFLYVQRTAAINDFNYSPIKIYHGVVFILTGYFLIELIMTEFMNFYLKSFNSGKFKYNRIEDGKNGLLILLAIMCLVTFLGFVYGKANELKKENDLTI